MREFPGVYMDTTDCVGYGLQDVCAMLQDGRNGQAELAAVDLFRRAFHGDVDISMRDLERMLNLLPAASSEHPELRFAEVMVAIGRCRYSEAWLLLQQLSVVCSQGQSQQAERMKFCVLACQALLLEQNGQLDQARIAFHQACEYLPARQNADWNGTLRMLPEEEKRLLDDDCTGIWRLLLDCLRDYQSLGDRMGLARITNDIGDQYLCQGEPGNARYWLEQSVTMKRGFPARIPLLFSLINLGSCYQHLGMWHEASETLLEAIALSGDGVSPSQQALALMALAAVHSDQGQYREALDLYCRSEQLVSVTGDVQMLCLVTLGTSEAYRRMGQVPRALELAIEAESFYLVDKRIITLVELQVGISETILSRPSNRLDAVMQLLEPRGNKRELVLVHWYLGYAACLAGDEEQALHHAERSLQLAMQLRHLSLLAAELPQSLPLLHLIIERGILPEATAGIVSRLRSSGLIALLDEPSATGLLADVSVSAAEGDSLHICLLGAFAVSRGGRELQFGELKSQKALQLLKILASCSGMSVSRELIVEALWEGSERGSAHGLEVLVSTLRRWLDRVVGPGMLIRRGNGYLLSPHGGISTDVAEFQLRLKQGHQWWGRGMASLAVEEWSAAERLYKGDFLAEDLCWDWALSERERLRESYLDLLIRLGDYAVEQHRCDLALQRSSLVLQADPMHEGAYRLTMLAHARQGNRAAAIRDYQRCAAVLREELGVEPMQDTAALFQRVCSGEPV